MFWCNKFIIRYRFTCLLNDSLNTTVNQEEFLDGITTVFMDADEILMNTTADEQVPLIRKLVSMNSILVEELRSVIDHNVDLDDRDTEESFTHFWEVADLNSKIESLTINESLINEVEDEDGEAFLDDEEAGVAVVAVAVDDNDARADDDMEVEVDEDDSSVDEVGLDGDYCKLQAGYNPI